MKLSKIPPAREGVGTSAEKRLRGELAVESAGREEAGRPGGGHPPARRPGPSEDVHDSALAEAEANRAYRARLVSQASDEVAWDLDAERDTVTWSQALERKFGLNPGRHESNRAWWIEQIHPCDRAQVAASVAASVLGSSDRHKASYRFRRADGSYAHVLDRGTLIRNADGKVVRAIGVMVDLSERKESEAALRLSEERFRLAATVAGLGVADIDMPSGKQHWSAVLRSIVGISEAAPARQSTYAALVHPDDREMYDRHLRSPENKFGENDRSVHRVLRPIDGALCWISAERHAIRNADGEIVRAIVTIKDITQEKTAQDRVSWAATHDAVTGLPNRTLFQASLDEKVAHARGAGEGLSVLLIDMDNFKHVNDTLGHPAGDRALAGFARRIAKVMPTAATIVRFGGDEFSVILPGIGADTASIIAGDLLVRLRDPISIGDHNVDLRASIGVSAFPDHGGDAAELVQHADLALYAAKKSGGSRVRTFEPCLRADRQRLISMLSQARIAVDNGWIEPFYQPKICLETNRVAGFEALLRWRHPRMGLQMPDTISSAFDDTEMAELLGAAMVEAVLADLRQWLDRGLDTGRIAINASAAEFRKPGYGERLLARLAVHRIPANLLELEITETAFLDDSAAHVLVALEMLRAAGMTIALDDFGTGYSSLSHLRAFPVDAIKIDQSFVAGVSDSAEDRAISEAVLRLGEALGMQTVGEGVETLAQAEFLRSRGCTLVQGHLYAPALPALDVPLAIGQLGLELPARLRPKKAA